MRKRKNRQPANPVPYVLIAVGLLLMLGAAYWLLTNQNPPEAASPAPTLTTDPNAPFPNVPRVSLEDARAAFEEQSAVFLDVRSAESYSAGHIPGAVSIPLAELESRAGELNPADWIITYCT